MTDAVTKTLSLSDIRRMKDDGHLPVAPDAPENAIDDPDFWAQATVVAPPAKKSVHLRLDAEVFDFFVSETQGKGHIRRMQDVLAAYMRAQRKRTAP